MHYIDFSEFDENAPYMKRTSAWAWVFNIPAGLSGRRDEAKDEIIRALQREHGCANVISGNANPLSRDQIGVYIYPFGVRHRMDGKTLCGDPVSPPVKLCRCFD